MSDFFGDDFTAELKKYFLESLLKEVQKYSDLVDEKTWKRVSKEFQELCQSWTVDANTNEFFHLASWLTQAFVALEDIDSENDFLQSLELLKNYLTDINTGIPDSEDLQKKYTLKGGAKNSDLYLHCVSGVYNFVIPVINVVEITSQLKIYATPSPEARVSGVVAFRGDPLPVIQLMDFGFSEVQNIDSVFVICEVNDLKFVLNVDRAEDFINISAGDLHDLNSNLIHVNSCAQKFFIQNDKNIIYLDIEKLVA